MKTLALLQDDVFSVLRDAAREFVTETDVTGYLNEAQRDLAARLGLLEKEASGTFAGGNGDAIDIPADFVRLIEIELNGVSIVDVNVDRTTFMDYRLNALYRDPPMMVPFDGKFQLHPTNADGVTWILRYVHTPVDLANDADVSELPDQLEEKLVAYGRWQGLLKMGELEASDRYLRQYEDGLPGKPVGRSLPGPISIGWEPGPFALDAEARHL